MRKYAAVILMAISIATAVASDVTYTTLTVAYGHARRSDGTVVDLKGLKFPAKIERVDVTRKNKAPASYFETLAAPAPPVSLALQALYWADQDPANTGALPYGEIDPEFPSCSVLDDIQINSNAVGVPWQQLTFGMDIPSARDMLIRWTVWNAYNPAAPNGTSAFSPYPVPSNYLLDFGVKWPSTQTQTGPIKVTLNIASAQVSAPMTNFWFSQQFRHWQFPGLPNAPFDDEVANLFNQSAPPQVGFSDVFYWLDLEGGLDGKYEEQEKDIFGEPSAPLQGNLLLKIEGNMSGSLTEVNPTSVTIDKGVYQSGDFTSLIAADDFYYKVKPDYTLPRGVPPVQVIVDGFTSLTNINSLAFSFESASEGGGSVQKIQLYRFQGPTPGWVDMGTDTLNGIDQNGAYLYTNSNPSWFLDTVNHRVRAKFLVTPDSTASRGFLARFDKAHWTLGTP